MAMIATGPTPKDLEIIDFLRAYFLENHYPASVREIGDGVRLRSSSSVQAHLDRLEASSRAGMVKPAGPS